MSSPGHSARRRALRSAFLLLAVASPAGAQRRAQEFTQQSILVSNFWVRGANNALPSRVRNDLKLGKDIGDALRDRLKDQLNQREHRVIPGYTIFEAVVAAGYKPDDPFTLEDLKQQATAFRTDEIITGVATRLPNRGVRLDAQLVLYRDTRMRQPIPSVIAPSVDAAVDELARRITAARAQLRPQRRCENALRDGQGQRAVQFAREGIAAYPQGALVRTCLVWALRAMNLPAAQVLAEAEAILAIDSGAFHGIGVAATSLDSLRRRDAAATMWLRLYATDTANMELAERVVWAMAEGGNSARAEPLIVKLSDAAPDNMRLMRQKWRVANDNRHWPVAIAAGEKLLAGDPEALTDSIFYQRLARAYRANGQVFKAMELVARGVHRFPGDGRLYALYTQFVKDEADSVLPRGLALFPDNAALLALNGQELRAKGQLAEALDASKKAVALDSTINQGRLLVAQVEMELGRPDSALATLWRAVDAGEDRTAIAQFALSKGNALLRAANATELRADYQLAMRFVALADSLTPTPQSKFVLGAAALKVAQTALTDAPKISVREESCALSRMGAETIPLARASLEAGRDIAADATTQFLEYLDQLTPYAEKQMATFCASAPGAVK